MLQYSSFLFGTVAIAGRRRGAWMTPAFATLMGLSILNHSYHVNPVKAGSREHRVIQWADRVLAHVIFAAAIRDAIVLRLTGAPYLGFYGSAAATAGIWLFQLSKRHLGWHALMHATSCSGMLSLCWAYSAMSKA